MLFAELFKTQPLPKSKAKVDISKMSKPLYLYALEIDCSPGRDIGALA